MQILCYEQIIELALRISFSLRKDVIKLGLKKSHMYVYVDAANISAGRAVI